MKKTLYWKLLLGYLIFGILGFILVSTVTAEVELHYLEKHTASDSTVRRRSLPTNMPPNITKIP